MTSVGIGIGRGRGWGKNTQNDPLRRPGQPCPGQKDEIIELIQNLDLNDSSFVDDRENMLASLLMSHEKSLDDDHAKNLELIYHEALNDRDFAKKILLILDNKQLRRTLLLSKLQMGFEKRDELLNESLFKFSNFTFLLCEFFYKFTKGPVANAVGVAVVTCFQMILDSLSEDDIELVVSQLLIAGQKLHSLQPTEMSGLGIQARTILISKNLSAKSRGLLTLMVDLDNQKYEPVSVELKKFYIEQLGRDIWNDSWKKDFPSLQVKRNSFTLDSDYQQTFPKNVPVQPPNQQPIKQEKTSPKMPAGNNLSRPRAIRGSGANDFKDRDLRNDKKLSGRKDKNSDAQWSNWNDGKKAWGHDDRFDKDY